MKRSSMVAFRSAKGRIGFLNSPARWTSQLTSGYFQEESEGEFCEPSGEGRNGLACRPSQETIKWRNRSRPDSTMANRMKISRHALASGYYRLLGELDANAWRLIGALTITQMAVVAHLPGRIRLINKFTAYPRKSAFAEQKATLLRCSIYQPSQASES